MTKQEVKDEYKQMEGDPLVKSRIRQVRMERARHRMMDAVPRADVVIVNPTHYAVALEYKMEKNGRAGCRCQRSGQSGAAHQGNSRRTRHSHCREPAAGARAFASVELDQSIPAEHFKAVAEVIGYVMQLKNPQAR